MNTLNFNNAKSSRLIALSAGLAIAATATIAPSADAASFSLNFDEGTNGSSVLYNTNGTLNTQQWADWGLKDITGVNRGANGAAKFNTYNSSSAQRGEDPDLRTGSNWGTAMQGNVLIIQEEDGRNNNYFNQNGVYRADDQGWRGGTINFDFDSAIALTKFSMLDIDDNGSGIRVTGNGENGALDIDIDRLINDHKAANGNSQGSTFTRDGVTITQVGTKRGNNSMYQFELDEAHFADMRFENVEFNYPGSGAISGLEWRTDDGPAEIPEPSVVGGLLMIGFVGVRKRLKSNKTVVNAA